MSEENNIKISIIAIIFSISYWFIYLSIDGSFMMQTIIPLILVLIAIYFLKKQITFKLEKNDKSLLLLIFIFLISTVLNCTIHIDYVTFDTIIGIVYFCAIFIWFFLIQKHTFLKKEIRFIINTLVLWSIVTSLQVIYMFFLGETGKISVISIFNEKVDANYFSALISIMSNFTLLKILWGNQKKKSIILCSIAFMLTIISIALSGSRAALLSLIFSNGIIVLQYIFKKFNLRKFIVLFIGGILLVIAISFLSSFLPTWLYNRYFVNSYSDSSNNERIEIWKNAIDGVLEQPYGYGFGMFDKLPEHNQISTGRFVPSAVPAHNTFLDILIYGGFLGEVVFLFFLYNIFSKFLKKKNQIFIPIILNLIFTSIIIGADKAVYFWNTLILLNIISKYTQDNEVDFL